MRKLRPLDDWCRDIGLPDGRYARVTLRRPACPTVEIHGEIHGYAPTEAENKWIRQILDDDPLYAKLGWGYPARTGRHR